MRFMMQNFGSKPQINCRMVIDVVMMIGFLCFMMNCFMELDLTATVSRRAGIILVNVILFVFWSSALPVGQACRLFV